MDEDEEVDREGGGRKMSDHLVLFLLHNNTHLQAISYFSNLDKAFANQKPMCRGVALTGALLHTLPSLRALIYISASLLSIRLDRCLRFLYSRLHIFLILVLAHQIIQQLAYCNIYRDSSGLAFFTDVGHYMICTVFIPISLLAQ